jgi:uncharacterized protein (TIGR00369 family)
VSTADGSFSDGKQPLPWSRSCFVCGEDNHAGLQTRFHVEDGRVIAVLRPAVHHCGYENVVHGGIAAAVLDECMGWAAAKAIGKMCVTAELTVRYIRPIPANCELTELIKASRRIAYCRGVVSGPGGIEYTHAEGKFTPLTAQQTLEVDQQLVYAPGQPSLFRALAERTLADRALAES